MDSALVLCRLLHYGSALLLFGIFSFQGWLAPAPLAMSLESALDRIVRPSAVIAFLSAVVWLMLASGEMGEGWTDVWNPATWYAVLFDTAFGHAWQIHLFLAAALLALSMDRSPHRQLATTLSAFHLGSLGLVGHAVMLDGVESWISCASHIVHLLAAGFWVGALIPLLLCLARLGHHDQRSDIANALRRFSGLGHLAVAAVIASGLINIVLVLGRWRLEIGSSYEKLLFAKMTLVVAMVALAIVNRYLLVPNLRNNDAALRGLRYATLAELILSFGVVALVSLFGTLPPQ